MDLQVKMRPSQTDCIRISVLVLPTDFNDLHVFHLRSISARTLFSYFLEGRMCIIMDLFIVFSSHSCTF
jgi:hypothetical protein